MMGQMDGPKLMVAVDPDALSEIFAELAALRAAINSVKMTPAPDWITATAYAANAGMTRRTVMNWIANGEIESTRHGNTVMIRANQAASPGRRRSRGSRP